MYVARAHVRVHTTSESCTTLSCRASRYIPNLGTTGPVVAEIARVIFSTAPQSARATCFSDHVDRSALVTFVVGEGLSNTKDGLSIGLVVSEIT